MKKLILSIIFTLSICNIYPQNDRSNLLKYWRYRDRLKYFVLPGSNPGESNISGIRNRINGDFEPHFKSLAFGQHGVFYGFYLGMLATEYKLLTDNGQDAWNTYYELKLALDAYEKMDMFEHYWSDKCGETLTDIYDGYSMRTTVPPNFLEINNNLGKLNPGLTSDNVWDENTLSFHDLPRGHPGWVNEVSSICLTKKLINGEIVFKNATEEEIKDNTTSQDEISGIMMGLALIVKCLPYNDAPFGLRAKAQEITNKLMLNLRMKNDAWVLTDPCGETTWTNMECRGLAYGFCKAADYIIEDNIWSQIGYSDGTKPQWQSLQWLPQPVYFNKIMECLIASMGDSWEIQSGVVSINSTELELRDKLAHHNIETFWLLYYAFLHDKNVDNILNKSLDQLNAAPCEGPYDYTRGIHAENGWASSYKWRKESWWQNGEATHDPLIGDLEKKTDFGNFNGLDYMLFYNLYCLYKGDALPGYWSYTDRDLGGNFPVDLPLGGFNFPNQGESCNHAWGNENNPLHAFSYNSIESVTTVHTHIANNENEPCPGNVVFTASNDILLKPGFLVEEGAYFHAYIDNFSCDEFMTTNKIVAENNEEKQPEVKLQNQSFLNVFPNPVSGKLTVNIRDDQNCSPLLFLTDMYGKTLLEKNIHNGSDEIDFSTYPAGVYLIKVVCGNITEVRKVVKQ